MADAGRVLTSVVFDGLMRFGSPSLLQPLEGRAALHDAVNVDLTSPGRIRPRPAARAGYEKGSAETANWPRMRPSAS